MIYGSLCSGIEAATQAFHPLGWTPAFFSEIDRFPAAVLAHHYGSNMPGEPITGNGVPNYGDMTNFQEWPDHAIDLLVGGTPCQSFSVAGLRKGLADPRGNLALTYLAVVDRYRPRWIVWENVPGVYSAASHDSPDPCPPDIDLDGGGGPEIGEEVLVTDEYDSDEDHAFACFLAGLQELGYSAAYRTLDAQYIRVGRFARAVPQRRRRVFVVGHLGDWRRAAAVLFDRESLSWHPAPRREAGQNAATTISARPTGGGGLGTDFDLDGGLISSTGSVTHCLNAGGMGLIDYETETMIAHALRGEGFDASEDGTGRGTPIVPVAFDCKGTEVQFTDDGSHPTLRSMGHNQSHQNAGGHAAVAFDLRGREGGAMPEGPHDTANLRAASGGSSRSYVAQPWAVRRLTPVECEFLQGFPRDFTRIPYRGKPADRCPDGPRYKALGNSFAVNVMAWIGERIALVDAMEVEE